MTPISGVYAAAVTPRREGPEADFAATFELIDFLGRSGIRGIALMGSTGEFPHFEIEERIRLVSLAVKRSRVPVIAGVGHSTFDGAVRLAREALDAGAGALLLMPPYFFRYNQNEVRDFYLRFAREIPQNAPLLLYNVPAFTTAVEPETAIELLSTGLFAGIKESSGSWENFARLKDAKNARPFTLLVGYETIFARARVEGADGIVSGAASAAPELVAALDHALTSGNTHAAARLDALLGEFVTWFSRFSCPVLPIREALAARGLKAGPHPIPLSAETEALMGEFREWFTGWLAQMKQQSSAAQAR